MAQYVGDAAVGSSPALAASQAGRQTKLLVAAGVLLVAALVPLVAETWIISLLSRALIFASLALGLQLIAGHAGQISFGHAAFFGIGAYTSAILTRDYGVPFPLAFIASAITAGLGGAVMSLAVRVQGVYFAIATFAFGIVVNMFFVNLIGLTGGARGMVGIPPASIGPLVLDTAPSYYLFVLAIVAIQYLVIVRLTGGRFGRALQCIRENELAARSIGIDVVRYKIEAIVIGCAFAGISGSLIAHFLQFASPEMFTLLQSINVVTMIVVGGMATPLGAVVGGTVMSVVTAYMTPLGAIAGIADGVVILLAMLFLPGGLVGLAAALWQRLRRLGSRPIAAAPAEEGGQVR